MRLGIPKGLLYYKYHDFGEVFFSELGAEIVTSENTCRKTLDMGALNCVDEACLPIKVFHGHIGLLQEKCDYVLVPRFMSIYKHEYICPKFCGLPEMIKSSYKNLKIIDTGPIYADSSESLYKWCREAARPFTKDENKIQYAYAQGMKAYKQNKTVVHKSDSKLRVALIGHPYNIYDNYLNMNIVLKLQKLGFGVITEDDIGEEITNRFSNELFKRPFWTFARRNYGTAVYLATNKQVDGIIYISSFACGIDSVVIELIKNRLNDFPVMVLKLDEQTGEAGFNTRLEAFGDMMKRS